RVAERAVQRRNIQREAEDGLAERDRPGEDQVRALPLEQIVRADLVDADQVAATVAGRPGVAHALVLDGEVGVHAARDFDFQFRVHVQPAFTAALRAALHDHLAPAAAGTAGLADREEAVGLDDLALSAALLAALEA